MTTQQKIQFFTNEVQYYIEYFGLIDWKLFVNEINKEEVEKEKELCATCYVGEIENRHVVISYNKEWINEENCLQTISQVAFHEVMELMLSRLNAFSNSREFYIPESIIIEEIHKIIRTLENKVFKLINDKRIERVKKTVKKK
jgi:hypothetical protein